MSPHVISPWARKQALKQSAKPGALTRGLFTNYVKSKKVGFQDERVGVEGEGDNIAVTALSFALVTTKT